MRAPRGGCAPGNTYIKVYRIHYHKGEGMSYMAQGAMDVCPLQRIELHESTSSCIKLEHRRPSQNEGDHAKDCLVRK